MSKPSTSGLTHFCAEMTSASSDRLPSEAAALETLQDAYYQLQHHQLTLEELWEASEQGRSLRHPAFMDRQLKEVADQADRVRATLDLVQSIRRYGHLIDEPQRLAR